MPRGVGEQLVGARLDAVRDVAVGGAAVGRVVLEAAVAGRVVRRGDDDAVGETGVARACAGRARGVERDDRARQRRGRRVLAVGLDQRLDAVRGEDLQRRAQRGRRRRVRVRAEKQRPGDAGARAVLADRLRDRQDVRLVEGAVLGSTPVAAGAEGDALARVGGIGTAVVVGGDQAVDVDQDVGRSGLSGERRERHGARVCLRSRRRKGSRARRPSPRGIPPLPAS